MMNITEIIGAPVCVNEKARLAALQLYDILDTESEEIFNRFTRLAASIYDVPVSVISLVDRDRQWFKSRHGLDASETPRNVAFCSYAILENKTLLINDASADPRFCNNPLVTGPTNIQFYAGAVLTTPDGFNLGTLCIIDNKPRPDITAESLASLEDLSKMIVTELELRLKVKEKDQALAEQTRSNDALRQFSAIAAHDLRAPLRHMVNFSELLREHMVEVTAQELDDETDKMLGYINQSGKRLQIMIAKILEFSTVACTESKFRQTPLHNAITEARDNLAGVLAEKSAVINVGDMPIVKGEPALLTLLLQNFIHNALKYSGDSNIVININAAKLDNNWCIAVEDNGPGIELGAQDQIFQLFSRGNSQQEGLGIGLALCQQIVSRHGGQIWLDKEYQHGARFCFSLPCHNEDSVATTILESSQAATQG